MKKLTAIEYSRLFLALFILINLLPGIGLAGEKIIVSILDDNSFPNQGDVYTLNPDGGDLQPLYHSDAGGLWDASLSPDGKFIYFTSDQNSIYTPTNRNVFRLSSDGQTLQQLTPTWGFGDRANQGSGVVTGRVVNPNGAPISGAPVYVEGHSFVSTGGDGRFRVEHVPAGARTVLAYSVVMDRYVWTTTIVVANQESQLADLAPNSSISSKSSYSDPVVFGDRLYYKFSLHELISTPLAAAQLNTIYQAEACDFAVDFNGFDIGSQTGKTAIMDYNSGCPTNRGLYIGGAEASGLQLFLDMKAETPPGSGMYPWNGGQDVVWSPDESRIALTASYAADGFNSLTYILIYDAASGANVGAIYFNNTAYTLYNVDLYDWSPDGEWLLFSYWLNSPSQSEMVKVRVNADGSIDPASMQVLLQNRNITGAAWGELSPASAIQSPAGAGTPQGFHLDANYPNPFNPETVITFAIPRSSHVQLAVYDLLGKRIRLLLDESTSAGTHHVTWNGTNELGESVASGAYIYRLQAAGVALSRKMIVLR